ncbi:MAG: hypothetical protein CM15mP21_5410 [Hyphomicrobiales bacterium]|nr:MAG: hypothetical protein CM15mP21_5410 [Hyphomicrobiales bacterium]
MLLDSDNFEVVFNLSDDEYGRFCSAIQDVIGRPVQVVWNVGGEKTALEATIERVGANFASHARCGHLCNARAKSPQICAAGLLSRWNLPPSPLR